MVDPTLMLYEHVVQLMSCATMVIIANSLFLVFLERIYRSKLPQWKVMSKMSDDSKRNLFTYIAEILITAVAFFILIPDFKTVFFSNNIFDLLTAPYFTERVSVASGLVIALYLFELVYKPRSDWVLFVHHLTGLVITVFTIFNCHRYMGDIQVAMYAFRVLYFVNIMATTEQVIFIGMICRRSEYHKTAAIMFILSIIHTLFIKCSATVGVIYSLSVGFFSNFHNLTTPAAKAYCVLVLIIALLLSGSQLYIVKIYFYLYKSSMQVVRERQQDTENATKSQTPRFGGPLAGKPRLTHRTSAILRQKRFTMARLDQRDIDTATEALGENRPVVIVTAERIDKSHSNDSKRASV